MAQSPVSVLVTGGNRGIGLGFVKEYLKNQSVKHVFAAARDPNGATHLKAISDPRLHIVKLDVQDDDSIKTAFKEVDAIVGADGLSLLINNSGIGGSSKLWPNLERAEINNVLDVNVTSPIIVSQIFLPLLRRASSAKSGAPWGIGRAAIVNISSGAGSISDNGSGGYLPYRASKTALNSLSKTMSIDLAKEEILVLAILPGYVATDMTGNKGALTVEESVKLMTTAIATKSKEDTGIFFGKEGKPFPL